MLLLFVVLTAMVAAVPPDTAAIEREAKQIEGLLIAPCCWTQPVSDHYSEDADRIRREVRAMLTAGQTRAAILDSYVARYGQRILVEPRAEGFGAFLHYLPWLFLVAGGALTVVVIRRFAGRAAPPAPGLEEDRRPALERSAEAASAISDVSDGDRDRLEDELGKLD